MPASGSTATLGRLDQRTSRWAVPGGRRGYGQRGQRDSGPSTSVPVTVDNTAPTMSVTFPANNGNYNASGWTGTITGTATDATSGISGASSISLTITQSSSGKTWNGMSFARGRTP